MSAGKSTLASDTAGEHQPMPSPDVRQASAFTFHRPGGRYCPPPGYVIPYRARHRALTSTLLNAEYAALAARADAQGLKPTQLATKVLRDYLARCEPIDADDFENATLVYGDGEP